MSDWLERKKALGMDRKNATLNDTATFRSRFEYGKMAQKKFFEYIKQFGIVPLKTDFLTFQENMPKVDNPCPDFEFNSCLIEIRRQDFYNPVLLGYSKKYNGWKRHSLETKKPLYFCMLSVDLGNLAFSNLTVHESLIYEKQNAVGNTDCAISLDAFKVFKNFDDGMAAIINIILDKKDSDRLDYWMK
jgi:hypothetical protein